MLYFNPGSLIFLKFLLISDISETINICVERQQFIILLTGIDDIYWEYSKACSFHKYNSPCNYSQIPKDFISRRIFQVTKAQLAVGYRHWEGREPEDGRVWTDQRKCAHDHTTAITVRSMEDLESCSHVPVRKANTVTSAVLKRELDPAHLGTSPSSTAALPFAQL